MNIKLKANCKYDVLSLGEVMIRFDPGAERIHTTRHFRAWEGGGEYNVARAITRCFKKKSAIVTVIVDNPIGRLLEDLILQGGVGMEYVKWLPYDGIGREVRNGLNFTERGFGVRTAIGCSDRGHTGISAIKPGDIDWDKIFHKDGVRWFHTGGVFTALSATTPSVALEAIKTAKKNGTIVSYDLNYRSSLWAAFGGQKKAREINREIMPLVDVLIGNEEDFTACLGFEVNDLDKNISNINSKHFKEMLKKVQVTFPNIKAIAVTLRAVKTASTNDWGAILFHNGNFYDATQRCDLEIYDRVGGGDSFASGLIYGFLENKSPNDIVNYGAAHGALAMTTPGDTSFSNLAEVEKVVAGKTARIDR